jgi:DNA invertase Pin-like site-specific DNA recombinase
MAVDLGDKSMAGPQSDQVRFVPYYRVSSVAGGRIGLGLQSQRINVSSFLSQLGSADYILSPDCIEVKSANKLSRRPELKAALEECQSTGATLLIARLSRLRRDATFLSSLCESRIRFAACDLPQADHRLVRTWALSAEKEGKKISLRTKKAMAAAKARGMHFGNQPGNCNLTNRYRRKGNFRAIRTIHARAKNFALQLKSTFDQLTAHDITSASGIAKAMNDKGIPTIGGCQWSAAQVQRIRTHLS